MKKFFTFCAAVLMACAVNAQTPSTDFAAPGYAFTGASAVLDGNIWYNSTDDYLYYNDKSVCGTATWTIQSTRACEVTAVLNMTNNKPASGHILHIEIFDSESNSLGTLQEDKQYTTTTDEALKGSIVIPAAGTYTVVLSNSQGWSSSSLTGITLTGKEIPSTDLSGTKVFAGADATLDGNIWYNSGNHELYYNDKEVCGTATWWINATKECYVDVTLNMTATVTSGHNCQVEIISLQGVSAGSVSEGGWHNNTTDEQLSGLIHVPAAGIYRIVLSNAQSYSSATLSGITLRENIIYPTGSVIYFDGRNYGNGMNIYLASVATSVPAASGDPANWYESTSDVIPFTLTEDVNMTTWVNIFKSQGSSWSDVAMHAPADNSYNIIRVNADGNGFTWEKLPTVMVAGNFTEPAWQGIVMDDEDLLSCTASITLPVGRYEFKIIDNNVWYGANGDFDRTNCTNWTLFKDGDDGYDPNINTGILADVPGEYVFTYTYATKKLDITYPTSFTRNAANDNFQTLCVPFNASITNAEVFEITGVANGAVTITPFDALLVAGKSYIVKPSGTMTITKVGDGQVSNPVFPSGTGLYGVLGADYKYVYNTESAKAEPWVHNYVLLAEDNLFHEVVADGDVTIKSTRAYLHIADGDLANLAPTLRIVMNTTNIENIEANEDAVKFFQNGQLFIKKNGVVYDMMGAVVK